MSPKWYINSNRSVQSLIVDALLKRSGFFLHRTWRWYYQILWSKLIDDNFKKIAMVFQDLFIFLYCRRVYEEMVLAFRPHILHWSENVCAKFKLPIIIFATETIRISYPSICRVSMKTGIPHLETATGRVPEKKGIDITDSSNWCLP